MSQQHETTKERKHHKLDGNGLCLFAIVGREDGIEDACADIRLFLHDSTQEQEVCDNKFGLAVGHKRVMMKWRAKTQAMKETNN